MKQQVDKNCHGSVDDCASLLNAAEPTLTTANSTKSVESKFRLAGWLLQRLVPFSSRDAHGPKPTSHSHETCPGDSHTSLLYRMSFVWVNRLLSLATKRTLTLNDLDALPDNMRPLYVTRNLQSYLYYWDVVLR